MQGEVAIRCLAAFAVFFLTCLGALITLLKSPPKCPGWVFLVIVAEWIIGAIIITAILPIPHP